MLWFGDIKLNRTEPNDKQRLDCFQLRYVGWIKQASVQKIIFSSSEQRRILLPTLCWHKAYLLHLSTVTSIASRKTPERQPPTYSPTLATHLHFIIPPTHCPLFRATKRQHLRIPSEIPREYLKVIIFRKISFSEGFMSKTN